MADLLFEESSRAFFSALAGLEKRAVELSPGARAALGEASEPDALDTLEAQASSTSSSPAGGGGAPPLAPPPLPPAETKEEESAPVDRSPTIDDQGSTLDSDEIDVEPESPEPGRATHGKLFTQKQAHPLALHTVLSEKYGDDWLYWEPETLWWAIRRDFGPMSDLSRNKIQALRVASRSYGPWSQWDIFEKCGLAWNDQVPIFGSWQPLNPREVAFTIEILKALHPEAPWDHEVAAYEGAVLDDAGLVFAPEEWFPGAQAVLDRHVDPRLKEDVAITWRAIAERDLNDVSFRADDPLDVHLAKLFAVRAYLKMRARLAGGAPIGVEGTASRTPTSPPVP